MNRWKEVAEIARKMNGDPATLQPISPSEALTLLDEIRALRGALKMWVDYDNCDEADFTQSGPMLLYADAIGAARDLLNQSN